MSDREPLTDRIGFLMLDLKLDLELPRRMERESRVRNLRLPRVQPGKLRINAAVASTRAPMPPKACA